MEAAVYNFTTLFCTFLHQPVFFINTYTGVTFYVLLSAEDNWTVVMFDAMRATTPWACIYFVALMLVCRYMVFNLFVAILLSNFAKTHVEEDEAQRQSLAASVLTQVPGSGGDQIS